MLNHVQVWLSHRWCRRPGRHISASKIHSLPSDKPSPDLEPFTEILIDHLVRVNFIQNHPPGTDWHGKCLLVRQITWYPTPQSPSLLLRLKTQLLLFDVIFSMLDFRSLLKAMEMDLSTHTTTIDLLRLIKKHWNSLMHPLISYPVSTKEGWKPGSAV